MRKRKVEIDGELVARAGAVLGTRGPRATIHRALEEVVARQARLRLVERLRTMEGLNLDDAAVMRQAWR